MSSNLTLKSANGYTWLLNEVEHNDVNLLIQKLNINEIIARILAERNISPDNAESFLTPTLRTALPDPFHLLDMEKAAEIIANSIINNLKIVIFGDYDVDGATSSALLKKFFSSLGIDVDIYIPDRIEEGYGPTIEAFSYLKTLGTDLIITVDCGTAAFEAIEFAVNNGLKIVVVDHHLSGETLPLADALVNPNRSDETSTYGYLAAVGVAFLMAIAVITTLRKKDYFLNRDEPSLLKLLDIVAIGTICDVVPLEPLNRAFVTQGLKILNKRQNPGIIAFCQLLNLNNDLLTSYHLGYVIGPRINAGGRVGESSLGARLLSTDNQAEALEIAHKLEIYNAERKAIEFSVYEQALEQAKQLSPDDALIMVAGENWHPGVIGIVAGRLKELFNKPVAVLSLDEEHGKSSCRSVCGVDFGSAIVEAKQEGIVVGGGGHKMAAGFTILKQNIPALKSFLHNRFTKELAALDNRQQRYFSAYLSVSAINLALAKQIEQISPFGSGNLEPRFALKNVYIAKSNIFAANHISCFIGCTTSRNLTSLIKANAFRAIGTKLEDILLNVNNNYTSLDLIGYIRINRWNGREVAEFVIDDVIAY